MNQELVHAVRERRALLFVGAGVSQNLKLPSFRELVDHLAEELDYDPEIYATQGDYLSLTEYYREMKGSIGPLRSWLDRTWHEGIDISASDVHRIIVELDFPIIYTTNYDRWIESAYAEFPREYHKIVNVSDIAEATPGRSQIVKFHGDFDDDESIVLTESDYFMFGDN